MCRHTAVHHNNLFLLYTSKNKLPVVEAADSGDDVVPALVGVVKAKLRV